MNGYFKDTSKQFDEFFRAPCHRKRCGDYGEATNRILKVHPDIAITNACKIVDARNYIIHGYDSLSPDILWSIVVNHLPLWEEEIEGLLNE